MMRGTAAFLATALLAGAAWTADRGDPVPYRVIPFERLGVAVNNWDDESKPKYAIITNLAEWKMAFSPLPSVNGGKTPQPGGDFFNREHLVAVSRASEAPKPGEKVLEVTSLLLVDNELVLSYRFIPPAGTTGNRVRNTLLLAIPAQYRHGIRFSTEIETPLTLSTKAELEEAKAAGRYKRPPTQP